MAASQAFESPRDLKILKSAERLSPKDAVELARGHVSDQRDDPKPARLREMGLHARVNADYRTELERDPELAKEVKNALTIGEPMPRGEWAQAKELAGGGNGRVALPKVLTDYSGKIVMVTDTHIVQQAGRNSVVAHDISKLEDRAELEALNQQGKLQNKVLKVSYGSHVGRAEALTFTQVRAAEVIKTAQEYAEKNLTSAEARDSFVQNVQKMMEQEIAKNRAPQGPTYQQARQPERAPERSR